MIILNGDKLDTELACYIIEQMVIEDTKQSIEKSMKKALNGLIFEDNIIKRVTDEITTA